MITSNDVNTYIILPHTFSAIRYMSDHFAPAFFNLEITLLIDPRNGKANSEEIGKRAGIGFKKIKVWLEMVLHDIILMRHDSDIEDLFVESSDNPVMHCPDEPDDVMIAALLMAKLKTIARGALIVDSISLTSSDSGYIKRVMHDVPQDMLPGIEYFGEAALHDKPWWERETIETNDFAKADTDADEYFAELIIRDPLKAIENEYEERDADIITVDTWNKGK
jgi:hypothetical protein